MKGKIILEEHVCMPDENAAERLKLFARDPGALAAALLDLHGDRLDEMNTNGVELAIISQNPPGPQGIRDPQTAMDYTTRSNDYISGLVDQAPERFAAFAAVSMHDPTAAIGELTRCVKTLGMVGVMLHDTQEHLTVDGRVGEYYYDDPRYEEFWKAVEDLDVPVYLHPKPPLADDMSRLYTKRPWLLGPTYSFARDTGFHFLALCTSGLFDRFPRIRLIVGHMGEMIPAHLGRIDHWLEKKDRGRTLPCQKTLREYLETNVSLTTAGNFSTTALMHAISEIGVDRILFSVDTPYENITEGAIWLDTLTVISPANVAKIGRHNTLRLIPRLKQRLRTVEVEKLQRNQEKALYLKQAGFPA